MSTYGIVSVTPEILPFLLFVSQCYTLVISSDQSASSLVLFLAPSNLSWGFPHSSVGKESVCNAGDPSSIPGSGRSPGEGIG